MGSGRVAAWLSSAVASSAARPSRSSARLSRETRPVGVPAERPARSRAVRRSRPDSARCWPSTPPARRARSTVTGSTARVAVERSAVSLAARSRWARDRPAPAGGAGDGEAGEAERAVALDAPRMSGRRCTPSSLRGKASTAARISSSGKRSRRCRRAGRRGRPGFRDRRRRGCRGSGGRGGGATARRR